MIIDFQEILESASVSEAAVSETTTIPEALFNTAIGMGTVFVVLILISFIIYLFKFIPKLLEIGKKKPEINSAAARPSSQNKVEQETAPAASQASNDAQLVAVIRAAIAAQMSEETGAPVAADGLVIRSIKKRTFSI